MNMFNQESEVFRDPTKRIQPILAARDTIAHYYTPAQYETAGKINLAIASAREKLEENMGTDRFSVVRVAGVDNLCFVLKKGGGTLPIQINPRIEDGGLQSFFANFADNMQSYIVNENLNLSELLNNEPDAWRKIELLIKLQTITLNGVENNLENDPQIHHQEVFQNLWKTNAIDIIPIVAEEQIIGRANVKNIGDNQKGSISRELLKIENSGLVRYAGTAPVVAENGMLYFSGEILPTQNPSPHQSLNPIFRTLFGGISFGLIGTLSNPTHVVIVLGNKQNLPGALHINFMQMFRQLRPVKGPRGGWYLDTPGEG